MASVSKASASLLSLAKRDLLSIAPMMAWTTRAYRYFVRSCTARTKLYTEMYVADTIHYANDRQLRELMEFEEIQRPLALQLGGSDPDRMRQAMRRVLPFEYDEYNLNCGCPSDKVAGKGCFGAALMLRPELVRDVVGVMVEEARKWSNDTGKPMPEITVKCRLGADDMDTYAEFRNFIAVVAYTGVRHFIVHARKCWLKGLDPKANRNVPPLRYSWVQRAALDFPGLRISVNGGVKSLRETDLFLGLRPRPGAGSAASGDGTSESKRRDETTSAGATGAGPSLDLTVKPRTAAEEAAMAMLTSYDSAGGTSGTTARKLTKRGVQVSKDGLGPDAGSRWRVRDDVQRLHDARAEWKSADIARRRAVHEVRAKEAEACRARGEQPPCPQEQAAKEAGDFGPPRASDPSFPPPRLQPGEAPLTVPEPVPVEGAVPLWFDRERAGGSSESASSAESASAAAGSEADGSAGGALIDSVMIGRQAYYSLWMLADADRRYWGAKNRGLSRREAILWYARTYIVARLRRAAADRHGMDFETAFLREEEDAVLEAAQEEGYRIHKKATGTDDAGGDGGEADSNEVDEAAAGAADAPDGSESGTAADPGDGKKRAARRPKGKKTAAEKKWLRRYGNNKVGCDCHGLLSPINCIMFGVYGASRFKKRLQAMAMAWKDLDYRRVLAWLPADAGAPLATGASSEGATAGGAAGAGAAFDFSREDYPEFDPVKELARELDAMLPYQLDEEPPSSHEDLPPLGWEGDPPRITMEMKAAIAARREARLAAEARVKAASEGQAGPFVAAGKSGAAEPRVG